MFDQQIISISETEDILCIHNKFLCTIIIIINFFAKTFLYLKIKLYVEGEKRWNLMVAKCKLTPTSNFWKQTWFSTAFSATTHWSILTAESDIIVFMEMLIYCQKYYCWWNLTVMFGKLVKVRFAVILAKLFLIVVASVPP